MRWDAEAVGGSGVAIASVSGSGGGGARLEEGGIVVGLVVEEVLRAAFSEEGRSSGRDGCGGDEA